MLAKVQPGSVDQVQPLPGQRKTGAGARNAGSPSSPIMALQSKARQSAETRQLTNLQEAADQSGEVRALSQLQAAAAGNGGPAGQLLQRQSLQRQIMDGDTVVDADAAKAQFEGEGIAVTPRGERLLAMLAGAAENHPLDTVRDRLVADNGRVASILEDATVALVAHRRRLDTIRAEAKAGWLGALIAAHNHGARQIVGNFVDQLFNSDRVLRTKSFAVVANASVTRGELAPSSDFDIGFVIDSGDVNDVAMLQIAIIQAGEVLQAAKRAAGITSAGLEFDMNLTPRATLAQFVDVNFRLQNIIQDVSVLREFGAGGMTATLDTAIRATRTGRKAEIAAHVRERLLEFNLPSVASVTAKDVPVNIKAPYMRFLSLVARDLGSFFEVDASSTAARLSALGGEGRPIPAALARRLAQGMYFLLQFRTVLHHAYNAETDDAVYQRSWSLRRHPLADLHEMNEEEKENFAAMLTAGLEFQQLLQDRGAEFLALPDADAEGEAEGEAEAEAEGEGVDG